MAEIDAKCFNLRACSGFDKKSMPSLVSHKML